MAFYNTYVNYNGNGSQQDFSVPFSYLSQSEVIVTFSGVGTYTYVFTSPNVIRTTPAVASGDSIRISRQTGLTSPKTVFSNGSALTAQDLNNQISQLLYGIQEFSDTVSTAMNTDVDGNWDADNKRIKNVLDPLLPTDTATKAYVDALSLSGGTISSSIAKTIVNHSGTGSQTSFALPFSPVASDFINVFISGVYVKQSEFTVSGNALVFNTAPANGTNNIEIQIIRLLGVYVNQDVNTAQIVNGAVTTAKIADANVTTAKVADGAITSAKIADGTIATADIANGAITSDKIADGTIASADIANGAIVDSKISRGVGTAANNLVALDGSAKLPAVDGSNLTEVNSMKLLGTVNTTSGNSVNISGLNLTSYKMLYVVFNNVTQSAIARIFITRNNTQVDPGVDANGASASSGATFVDLITGSAVVEGGTNLTTTPSGPLTSSTIVYFRNETTATFTGGSISIYGIK